MSKSGLPNAPTKSVVQRTVSLDGRDRPDDARSGSMSSEGSSRGRSVKMIGTERQDLGQKRLGDKMKHEMGQPHPAQSSPTPRDAASADRAIFTQPRANATEALASAKRKRPVLSGSVAIAEARIPLPGQMRNSPWVKQCLGEVIDSWRAESGTLGPLEKLSNSELHNLILVDQMGLEVRSTFPSKDELQKADAGPIAHMDQALKQRLDDRLSATVLLARFGLKNNLGAAGAARLLNLCEPVGRLTTDQLKERLAASQDTFLAIDKNNHLSADEHKNLSKDEAKALQAARATELKFQLLADDRASEYLKALEIPADLRSSTAVTSPVLAIIQDAQAIDALDKPFQDEATVSAMWAALTSNEVLTAMPFFGQLERRAASGGATTKDQFQAEIISGFVRSTTHISALSSDAAAAPNRQDPQPEFDQTVRQLGQEMTNLQDFLQFYSAALTSDRVLRVVPKEHRDAIVALGIGYYRAYQAMGNKTGMWQQTVEMLRMDPKLLYHIISVNASDSDGEAPSGAAGRDQWADFDWAESETASQSESEALLSETSTSQADETRSPRSRG